MSARLIPSNCKQWGGVKKSKTGRAIEGRTYDDVPDRPLVGEPATKGFRLDMIEEVNRWMPELQCA